MVQMHLNYMTHMVSIELTEEIATQEGITVDIETFENEMQQQRDR